jgi:DNA-directed RNA polymerase subunit H (RpoH/RPB5)/adenylate kinase family enzyme
MLTSLGLDMKMVDRYFKIHRTVVEMLIDRGFLVSQDELDSIESTISFMNYISASRTENNEQFLTDLISDFLEDEKIVEKAKDDFEEFIEDRVLPLARRMDASEIYKEISSKFKVKDKTLSAIISDRITKHMQDMPDAVESLSKVYENKNQKKLFVYYFFNVDEEKKESKKRGEDILTAVKDQQDKPENASLKDVILVVENKLNSGTMENLKFRERIKFTIFLGDHLLFNITKHFLVPKHKLITKKEFEELTENKEKGFVQNLPKIYETDPISRYYGAKPGQIFKITRESLADDSMVKTSIFYRHVIPELLKK